MIEQQPTTTPASEATLATSPNGRPARETGTRPLVEVKDLVKYYPITGGIFKRKIGDVRAVDGVSFSVDKGEILGLVGESGCGKSTLGRTIIRLQPFTSGEAYLDGEAIFDKTGDDL